MVIGDFNFVRIVVLPAEAYSPLVVDANAPLARTVALQSLQPIAGQRSQVFKPPGVMHHAQLAQRHSLYGVVQPPGKPTVPDALRLPAGKARDHGNRLG